MTMFEIGSITSNNLNSFLPIFGDDLLRATISLFAVINPIGTIPLFASITQKMQKNERDRVLKTTVVTAGALLMIFAVAGTQILSIFGITISIYDCWRDIAFCGLNRIVNSWWLEIWRNCF